jgi:hypothetical protein
MKRMQNITVRTPAKNTDKLGSSKLRQSLRYIQILLQIWRIANERFLAILCNRNVTEIYTDFLWIS